MPYFEVPVGVAESVIAPASPGRRFAIVSNPSAVDVYLAFGQPAAVGQSLRLPAGSPPTTFSFIDPGLFGGAVHAIAAAAGGRLAGFVDQ